MAASEEQQFSYLGTPKDSKTIEPFDVSGEIHGRITPVLLDNASTVGQFSGHGRPLRYSSPSLANLPDELIAKILSYIEINSFKQLALTCKRFSRVGDEILYRKILVSNMAYEMYIMYGIGDYPGYTFSTYHTFINHFNFSKQHLVKTIHFEDPKGNVKLSNLKAFIKMFPDVEILVSDRSLGSEFSPISVNPAMAFMNPYLNGECKTNLVCSPLITKITINQNIIPGEVLYKQFVQNPALQSLTIDNFYFNKRKVFREDDKLKIRFLYITGDNYSDLFDIIQLKSVKHLHLEHIDPKGDFLLKLEGLEALSIGAIPDKDVHLLSGIPSNTIRCIHKYFREKPNKLKIIQSAALLQDVLPVLVTRTYGAKYGHHAVDFYNSVEYMYNFNYKTVWKSRANPFTTFKFETGRANLIQSEGYDSHCVFKCFL